MGIERHCPGGERRENEKGRKKKDRTGGTKRTTYRTTYRNTERKKEKEKEIKRTRKKGREYEKERNK